MLQSAAPSPIKFMLMKQHQVLDAFHDIPTAYSDGYGQKRFVYIPGTRDDRVLLVAHSDTVWDDQEIKIGYKAGGGIFYSRNRGHQFVKDKGNRSVNIPGVGIGADDRAGCAILWYLRDLGHSILITSGEEDHGVGSSWIMKDDWWRKEINARHNFVIQFDRRGDNDVVFYDVGSKKFAEYVEQSTNYVRSEGTFTDICNLCEDICGVNMSVGYYDEHRTEEKLVYRQWIRTLYTAREWLSKKGLPKFKIPKTPVKATNSWQQNIVNTHYGVEGIDIMGKHSAGAVGQGATTDADLHSRLQKIFAQEYAAASGKIACMNCGTTMYPMEYSRNQFSCKNCNNTNCF